MRFGSACALALAAAACGTPAPARPRPDPPPALPTASIPAILQGPGSRWTLVVTPRRIFSGPLAVAASRLVPKEGLDRLADKLGFDPRASTEALLVEYGATNLWAARLPDGVGPSAPLEAFEKRLLPPRGRATPRPDLVRVWGALPSGARGSAVGIWSTAGDLMIAESGRVGPTVASMALATGKLDRKRALDADATFGPLLAWAKGAELAWLARCPLTATASPESGPGDENPVLRECFGAGVTVRPQAAGKIAIAVRVTGAWGADATGAAEVLRATFERIAASDLGRNLGLREVSPTFAPAADAIDAGLVVDGELAARGLRRLLDAEIEEATR